MKKEGFKSFDEVDKYLKAGGVIGDFYGKSGDDDHSNNFIVYDKENDEYLHRREVYEDFSIDGKMKTRNIKSAEFRNWVMSLENFRDDEGNIQTTLFHRNFDCDAADTMEVVL